MFRELGQLLQLRTAMRCIQFYIKQFNVNADVYKQGY